MYNKHSQVFLVIFFLLLPFHAESAGLFAPPIPARIGGSVTVDGSALMQAADNDYTFTVTKQDGTAYVDFNDVPAQDLDGLNSSDWYLIDIPIYDATDQPGGAVPGETALIHVFKDGSEFTVTSPANGEFIVDSSGTSTQIDLEVDGVGGGGGGGGGGGCLIETAAYDFHKTGDIWAIILLLVSGLSGLALLKQNFKF